MDGAQGPREPSLPGPSHVSAFRKPSHPHPVSSPKKKYSSLSRRKGMRPEVNGDQSDPELPSFDRLPIRPELQRPDSVITTSSIVSSEAEASVIEEAETEAEAELSSLPPPAPPTVYTISGLYGSSVPVKKNLGDSLDPGDQQPRTHKRSASTMATSIVIRGCQKTHKRSHSHTVGYGQPHHGPGGHGGGYHHHRRTGSSGFVMGHRRTVSGASAIVDTLEKITGGHSRLSLNASTSDYLHGIQAERRASSRIQDATAEEEEMDKTTAILAYPGKKFRDALSRMEEPGTAALFLEEVHHDAPETAPASASAPLARVRACAYAPAHCLGADGARKAVADELKASARRSVRGIVN